MSAALCFQALLVGLILSADSFSAAIAMGGRPFTRNDALKFAVASGGAELFSTFAGYMAGAHVISLISAYDHWVAFALLAGVALHMAYEGIQGLRQPEVVSAGSHFHSFSKILLVSFATSLDAFGVGVGLGVADAQIAPYLISIGAWAFATTLLGLYLARKLSVRFGPVFTLFAALVLGLMSFEMLKI